MAVTFATTVIHETVFGNKRVITADLVCTGTVVATGDAYLPAAVGLKGFDMVMLGPTLSGTGTATTAGDVGYFPTYDYVNQKIVITHLGPADLASVGPSIVATGVNVGNVKFRAMIVGY
jgi:hypothetical protein